jgi:Uma2 family endonuclease
MSEETLLTDAPPAGRSLHFAPPYRFKRDAYHAMADAGIFHEDDRVELIAGQVIAQMPIGTTHVSVVNRLNQLFSRLAAGRAIVSIQNPVNLDPFTEPQPDLALLRPRADFYADSLPTPADVLLVIEVADTSLAFDREEKLPLYAAASILEVWLVDLVGKQLVTYRRPTHGNYAETARHRAGALIPVLCLPDSSVAVSELGL